MKKQTLYERLGVSATKKAVHKATRNLNKGAFPGAFCNLFPNPNRLGWFQLLHSDTAGTKAALACLMYITTHDPKHLAGIPLDAFIMNENDGGCVGAVDGILLTQTICRNPFVISDYALEIIIESGKRHCDKLRKFGINLTYASGETADTADLNRTLDIGSSLYADIRGRDVIDASRMAPGDVIVGFSSTGKAAWEDEENFGPGSNGFTAMRHGLLSPFYRRYKETFAPQLKKGLPYHGKHRLNDLFPGSPKVTIGRALLSPTRCYLPLIKLILSEIKPKEISGIIHCSGGGQTKIKNFGAAGNRYVKGGETGTLFPIPPLFQHVQSSCRMPWKEMYETTNMGWMLEIAFRDVFSADRACQIAYECGITPKIVGRIQKGESGKREVVIVSPYGTFTY